MFKEGLDDFREALDLFNDLEASPATNLMQAHLNCDMAWSLINDENELKRASEYSSAALSFAEQLQNQVSEHEYQHALGRSLYLVALCYARAESALTAEGLFQSAIDSLEKASTKNPLAFLDLRDAHQDYEELLLFQWEKRSGDAEKQQEKVDEAHDSLPGGWIDQPSLYSGLVFITP